MTTLRAEMTWPFELSTRRRLPRAYLWAPFALATAAVGCYSMGNGSPPPSSTFYFPVGMAVSHGGNVLYVVNSDFDLQWNGGTVQSYDLYAVRRDAAISAAGYSLWSGLPFDAGGVPVFVDGGNPADAAVNLCASGATAFLADGGFVSACAPFINAGIYERDSVTIGAFATDLQLSPWGNRMYVPVRGNATITWLTITPDVSGPPSDQQRACDHDAGALPCYDPFTLQCNQVANGGRCDEAHHAGINPNEPGDTRNLTMPGEPFAMAQSADGTAIVLTHQSEGDTTLFLTGFVADGGEAVPNIPSLQFVADAGLPTGGDGIASIPHDPAAFGCEVAAGCDAGPRPAFLETNNTTAELSLIRYYADNGTTVSADAGSPDANLLPGTTLQRPFLEVEETIPITVLSGGTDSRDIVFDTSARLRCEHEFPDLHDARHDACGRLPARMFFANRTPDVLVSGTVGGQNRENAALFDPDAIQMGASFPDLDSGPSRVYLAPIIDSDGDYALRVFVVCFNGNVIDVINPDTSSIEARIPVGEGPFAMSFDPFDPVDLALGAHVQPIDQPVTVSFPPDGGAGAQQIPLPKYRFAYVASFTNSYVQVIDLDDSESSKATFESVVYTLGTPSVPKGNQ